LTSLYKSVALPARVIETLSKTIVPEEAFAIKKEIFFVLTSCFVFTKVLCVPTVFSKL